MTLFFRWTTVICLLLAAHSSAFAQQLTYSVKAESRFGYKVTITATTPSAKETMQGILAYNCLPSDKDVITLEFRGGLRKTTTSIPNSLPAAFGRSGLRLGGDDFYGHSFDPREFGGLSQSENNIVLSTEGKLHSLRGESRLPYLLGNLSTLPFELLPQKAETEWKKEGEFIISSEIEPRFAPFFDSTARRNIEKKVGGTETISYKIEGEEGHLVKVSRKYEMSSPASTPTDTGFQMQGNGWFLFNRDLGLPESLSYEMNLLISSNSADVRIPITVAIVRMTEEELGAHQKRIDEDIAKTREWSTRLSRPIPAADRDRIIGHLKSEDDAVVLKELTELSWSSRRELFKEDIVIPIQAAVLLSHKNEKVRDAAMVIWSKWGTSVEKHASEDDKKRVAEAVKQHEEMAGNPFEVEGEDDGKGIRTWSDKSGRFKVEGEFQQLQGGMVVLKDKDGKTVRVPKARLSESDQTLIEKLSKK